ncbi:hypothetical protein FGG08_006357 [Glutinoglossum americanum]|uniref:Uncharacterized protein n=1 Tax=Glutinoglossum americanum TaxID=1670608 RepID=A0A9P8I1E9_9PEZI|nr:hypothetical protein FGG08_006357 [Glutinoglossum americanum]
MITGVAVLASGYSQLQNGISSHHWQVIVHLAWYSSLTHLAALTVLRTYLRKDQTLRFWGRSWRLFFMFALITMLVVAILPTGSEHWLYDGSIPVKCFYARMRSPGFFGGDPLALMAISMIILLSSYLARAVKLFEPSSAFARNILRDRPRAIAERFLSKLDRRSTREMSMSRMFSLLYGIGIAGFVIGRAVFDLAESIFFEVRPGHMRD